MILTALKSVRVWLIAGGLAAAVGSAWVAYNKIYQAGYDAAQVKYQTEQLRAVEDALASARAEWEVSRAAGEAEVIVEEKIVERVRVVEREVPRVVERVVRAECRDLGPDVQRLFNDAIRAGGSDEGSDSAAAAELDG